MATLTTGVVSFTSIIDSTSANTSSTTGVTVITRLSISSTTDDILDTTTHTVCKLSRFSYIMLTVSHDQVTWLCLGHFTTSHMRLLVKLNDPHL